MRIFILSLLIATSAVQADNTIFGVDLTQCVEKDCMANEIAHDFKPSSNIEVFAGYNVVHWEDRGSKLYPLFHIYNRTGKSVDVEVGLQLLDADKSLILELMGYKTLDHTNMKEHSYETYVPLNAGSVNTEILNKTKYMKVVFKEISA